MFGKKKNQKLEAQSVMTPVKALKEGKTRILRVTVFPKEGGRPYVADVAPDEQGSFDLQDKQTFKVSRGSVWEENGILRAICNEGNPQTINAFGLIGDDSMNPTALHGIASNNLWIQLDTLAKRKSVWKSASTWGIIAIGVTVCLLLLWQVKTLGDGMSSIQHSLEGLRAAGAAPEPTTAQSAAGHNNIAPSAIGLLLLPFSRVKAWVGG